MSYLFWSVPFKFMGQNPKKEGHQGPGWFGALVMLTALLMLTADGLLSHFPAAVFQHHVGSFAPWDFFGGTHGLTLRNMEKG